VLFINPAIIYLTMNKLNTTTIESKNNKLVISMPFAKVNKEKRTVSGWASLDNLDRHGDIVTAEANKKAFDGFRGNIRQMHTNDAVGKMLNFKEDMFFDPESQKKYNGIYVTAYISKGAQDAWEKCLDGTYTGFSIGGNIVDAKMEKSDDGKENRRVIHNYDLHELSLVDSPANQLANFMSIEKNIDGSSFVKGMIADITLENVFWCKNDEVASTSEAMSKDCVVCDTPMTNIGWVEQKDIEKFEAIEKVIDSYFKKDDAPTSAHQAGETAAPGLAGNVIDSNNSINLYPDQNPKQKVTLSDGLKKSDDISLTQGGNKMAEDTETTIDKSVDVETPAEEVSKVKAIAEDTSIEKAASISEVEDAPDFEKAVASLKSFFAESLTKSNENYATHAATVQDMYNIVNETRAEMARLSKGYEDIQKSNEDIVAKYETLNKSVTDMFGKIEYVDHALKNFEAATAVQKSVGVSAPIGQTKTKQSIWQGAFLSATSI
jgi:hypothetical protein